MRRLSRWVGCALAVVAMVVCLWGCGKQQEVAEAMDMGKDDVIAAIKDDCGVDFSEYVDAADGVEERPSYMDGSLYTVDLTIRKGSEDAAEQTVIGLCGKGSSASSRKRPVIGNRISSTFDQAELLMVYDYMRAQSPGSHATVTTEFYTANVGDEFHVFVLW